MKSLKYSLLILITGTAFLVSCKKDKNYLYNDVARVQFGPTPDRIYNTSFDFADTLKRITFYYDDASVTTDTAYFDIYAIGGIKDYDRSFTLQQVQVPDTANAVAGKHYVAFDDPKVSGNYVIKAGTVHATVPVILMRDSSLKKSTPILKFIVVANKNFQLGEANKLWRKLEVTDRLSQPSGWTATYTTYYLGKYSVVKHAFMINVTGKKWDQDFFMIDLADYSLLNYYRNVLKTELINYNKTHPPLTDEFGDPVVFP